MSSTCLVTNNNTFVQSSNKHVKWIHSIWGNGLFRVKLWPRTQFYSKLSHFFFHAKYFCPSLEHKKLYLPHYDTLNHIYIDFEWCVHQRSADMDQISSHENNVKLTHLIMVTYQNMPNILICTFKWTKSGKQINTVKTSITRSRWDHFYKSESPEVRIKFTLRVILTCKIATTARIWVQKDEKT